MSVDPVGLPGAPASTAPAVTRLIAWLRSVLPNGGSLPAESAATRHRLIVALLWLHVGAVIPFALVMSNSRSIAVSDAAVLAVPALLASIAQLPFRLRALVASIGLLMASAVFVHLSGGYIELHFHYFVMVAVIALYQDWIAFLAGIAFVGFHHGVFGVIAPETVFNHRSALEHPWRWALLHAGFIASISVASLANWRLNELARQKALAAEQQVHHLAAIVASSEDAIISHDLSGRILSWNAGAERMLGFHAGELLGSTSTAFIPPEYREEAAATVARVARGQTVAALESVRLRSDGTPVDVAVTLSPIRNERGEIVGTSTILRDIGERKRLETRLAYQAYHDTLTGLPNRRNLQDRLDVALATARRGKRRVAVLFVDLDGFKEINDEFGHPAGDAVLVEVASRITSVLRDGDSASRLGGDEFTIVAQEIESVGAVEAIAARLLASLDRPFQVAGQQVGLSASIGIALSTGTEDRSDELLRQADVAMYQAKAAGKRRYAFFTPSSVSGAK